MLDKNTLDTSTLSDGAQMFANRLNKNLKHLRRWLKRENIHCYRIYDADIPEYALAIDIYQSAESEQQRWVHVQEYEAPKHIDQDKAQQRLNEALSVLRDVLQVSDDQLFLKVRRQQKGKSQYEKLDQDRALHKIIEADNYFLVNLKSYLDTGIFLDHRITRELIGQMAKGKRFLNLFAYTGSATVYAAKANASSTTTIDMSRTYLDWAKRNMVINGFTSKKHEFIQDNCLAWLDNAAKRRQFELIFLDPPSFSTSKRMEGTFDVQRDHVQLLKKTASRLTENGTLIFSNNRRHFKMDHEALADLKIENISKKTLPIDFERNPRIHNCWKITRLK